MILRSLLVCLALAPPASPPAPTAPPVAPPPAAPVDPPPPDPLTEAQALYLEGAARYELTDYEGAISRWVDAAARITDEWRRAQIVYNIAEAHLKAYDRGRDPGHLRSARALYTAFLADVQHLDRGRETLSTDVANATVAIERIDRQLAERERDAAAERELLERIAAHTLRPDLSPRTRALRGVGVAFTATGVAALGLLAAGLVLGQRHEEQAGLASLPEDERVLALTRGARANHLAIAGAVLGASFLAVGLPTLAVGAVRARRERDEARQRLRPALAPDRVGLVWEGRF